MTEQITQVGDVEIAYETFGDPGDPAMLLVMGLGIQMIGWDEELCRLWADRGFYVIRFDNRDTGHSSQVEGGPPPDLMAAVAGDLSSASYLLADMADDAVGLLDHLGIDAAHVVGVSMGGMIAQTMAIRHPERVLSLTSIMSTYRRSGGRPAATGHPARLAGALAERSAGLRRLPDRRVSQDRLTRIPGRRGQDPEALRAELRPLL